MIDDDQKIFLDALKQSLGIVSAALQQTGYSQEDYRYWMEDYFFEQEVNKINQISIDFVENQLMKQIRDGDLAAITFYLKTKGKERGY